jgi:hypothetical protein
MQKRAEMPPGQHRRRSLRHESEHVPGRGAARMVVDAICSGPRSP